MTPEHTNPKQEIAKLIGESKRILLTTHENPDADAAGSLLALSRVLQKLGKQVYAVSKDPLPETLGFLPGTDKIIHGFESGRELRIQVSTKGAPVGALRYETGDDALTIILDPKDQPILSENVKVQSGQGDWDLLIVLDSPELRRVGDVGIGEVGSRSVINIDHHTSNEKFGTVNLVIPEASSTTEILLGLIESIDATLLDAEISTCLYVGLIGDTSGFLNRSTSAKTLSVAAQLIGSGADHHRVVQALHRISRDASTLRLWGHAMASLRLEPEINLAWARLGYPELVDEGKPDSWSSSTLMNSLLGQVKGARLVALLSEPEPGTVQVSMRVPDEAINPPDISRLAKHYGGGGHTNAAAFRLERTSLDDFIEKELPEIREFMKSGILPKATDDSKAKPVPVTEPTEEVTDIFGEALPTSETERIAPKSKEPNIGVWKNRD
jgi:phosphoesterase RecJ-like protein